ncbi:MAG: hypothetical protein EXR71_10735 [Myxococcales bacterium]|nr:hypothetical protein [Myxococcales bacterium]
MSPLHLVPHLTRPPWGGHRLAALGKGEGVIGESWEVWRENRVRGDDRPFGAIVDFPLLVKLLDTQQILSVQVHPGDVQARERVGAPHGKAEAWVVLEATPGARIAYGLARPLSERQLRERAESGEIEADLAWLYPQAGDVIEVPPGTIHAIGPGLLLYEVQQPIDLTWRLYDWGRGRELHLDHACAVARREPLPSPFRRPLEIAPGIQRLIEAPHFVVERVTLPAVRHGWEALTLIEGAGEIDGAAFGLWTTVVLPPGATAVSGAGVALASRPGLTSGR